MNQFMFLEMVQNDLSLLEVELDKVLVSNVDLISDIGRHLMQAGGKRLRPALFLLCAWNKGKALSQELPIAVAIELIHAATLVHDDVIDNADTRRGRATPNVLWGNYVSVLSGDYLFAKAFSIVAKCGSADMIGILSDAVCSMCEGEIMGSQQIWNINLTEKEYIERIGRKTADFIAASCQLGAIAANLSIADALALRRFGYLLGLAFQITDDILDFTATPEQLGKPVGNDLSQGVITLPVIFALQHRHYGQQLRALLERKATNTENMLQCVSLVKLAGGIEYSYMRVGAYLQQAREALASVTLEPKIARALGQIIDFVRSRKF